MPTVRSPFLHFQSRKVKQTVPTPVLARAAPRHAFPRGHVHPKVKVEHTKVDLCAIDHRTNVTQYSFFLLIWVSKNTLPSALITNLTR